MPRTRTLLIVLGLTAVALTTRLAFLDADPARFKRVHELFDEGYWAHNARSAVLFGTRYPDDLAQAATSAPLFDWITERVFRAAGVGYAQLRLTSALAAALLVPVVWALVAVGAGRRAALVAALLVLGNHELFAFGRLGLPESLQLLLAIAGGGVWTFRGGQRDAPRRADIARAGVWGFGRAERDAAIAGALFGLALLAKLNVVLVLGFAGVWVLEAWQRRLRVQEVLMFAAGFVPPVALWGVWGYLPNQPLFALNQLALNRDRLAQQWSDLVRLPLHFLDAPFWGLPSTYALLLLAAVPLVRGRRSVRALTALETLALGWIAGIVIPSALLVRSIDERRLLVVSVMLAILGALSWHRALPRGPADDTIVAPHRPDVGSRVPVEATGAPPEPASSRAEATRGLALMTAVAIAVVAVALVFRAGHGTRLWSPSLAALVVVGTIALAVRLDRIRRPLGRRGFMTVLVAALAVLPAINAGEFVDWLAHGIEDAAPLLAMVVAAIVVAATVSAVLVPAAGAVRGVAVAYALYAILALGVNLVVPTYTLRDASRGIAAAAPPDVAIVGALAHTLSLENRTKPIWYTPRRALNQLLNPDLARFDVRLVLTVTPPSRFFPDAADYPFPLTPIGRFGVYPSPHVVGAPPPKAVLTLFRRDD